MATKYPVQVNMSYSADYEDFFKPGPTMRQHNIIIEMTFNVPERLDIIEQAALMYCQFDNYMKERFGEYIRVYQDSQRGRRIDEHKTEPGTDTGNK